MERQEGAKTNGTGAAAEGEALVEGTEGQEASCEERSEVERGLEGVVGVVGESWVGTSVVAKTSVGVDVGREGWCARVWEDAPVWRGASVGLEKRRR